MPWVRILRRSYNKFRWPVPAHLIPAAAVVESYVCIYCNSFPPLIHPPSYSAEAISPWSLRVGHISIPTRSPPARYRHGRIEHVHSVCFRGTKFLMGWVRELDREVSASALLVGRVSTSLPIPPLYRQGSALYGLVVADSGWDWRESRIACTA